MRESGAIFAGPTYLFILSMIVLIVGGFFKYYTTGQVIPTPEEIHYDESVGTYAHGTLTGGALLWLLLRSFAAGCTALTGVEAISNGVPAFKEPESKNASVTLTWMAVIMMTLILGTGFLAYQLNAHPTGHDETLVSAMTRHTFGTGILYYIVQAATAAILVLAANTAFADFPRLASLLAADRFLPRQLSNRGDRLVFSNGIIVLALLAIVLVVVFKGQEQAMLPLYALGVFISFTLSQSGMVIHWLRERKTDEVEARIIEEERSLHTNASVDPGMRSHEEERLGALEADRQGNRVFPIVINSLGAIVTFAVLIVIAITKFTHGAWAVIVVITLIVFMFRAINWHYQLVAAQLSLDHAQHPKRLKQRVIIPISGIHRGVLPALQYAHSICGTDTTVTAVYVATNPQNTNELLKDWEEWGQGIELKVIDSPYRSLVTPLVEFITAGANPTDNLVTTVILPEFIPRVWWQNLLHNQVAFQLKARLLFESDIIVTSVPYHLRR